MSEEWPHVELYTDGACSGNPGPGGWAYILKHPGTKTEKEASGGEPSTTNNKMELMSVIKGLNALDRPCRIDLYSDSQYVIKGLSDWMDDWKKKDWKRPHRQTVKNIELWKQLDELRQRHKINYHWVRGHNDHPENERCDRLAVAAIDQVRHVAP